MTVTTPSYSLTIEIPPRLLLVKRFGNSSLLISDNYRILMGFFDVQRDQLAESLSWLEISNPPPTTTTTLLCVENYDNFVLSCDKLRPSLGGARTNLGTKD